MKHLTEYAYAKINLSLDVLEKRGDGYHEMKMLMQTASLCDDINIAISDGHGNISVTTNRRYLPSDSRNIAWKAASLFISELNIRNYDISIDIKKRIPVCAGLGGGSADGAAVLRGLDRIFGASLGFLKLEALGERLGSDVPFCIAGGTSLAYGRGELIEPLSPMPDCHIVICKPAFAVSTPELFKKIDSVKLRLHPDTEGMISAIEEKNLPGIAHRLYNVFEDAGMERYEEILSIKNSLYDSGALGSVMSGTGSAVYGIFDCREKAENAFSSLSAVYEECFLAQTQNRLIYNV